MFKNFFVKLYNFFFNYPTPSNLTNVWNFGILAFIFLMTQIITGLLLSLYYVPTAEWAFEFVEYLVRDTYLGWYIRYLHANGASFFFFVVYVHFFRSIYYFSYLRPKLAVWNTGVLTLLLLIITAFTGYVLPWGQMSFWAATVITNLATVIPCIGDDSVKVIWGSYSVSTTTLNRFYTIHFILPFVILSIIILHFMFLHKVGSSNNLELNNKGDKIPFHPYYTIKDVVNVLLFILLYVFIVRWGPNLLAHSDNYIPADPLVTPSHIVPEWYFLAFYAMLRSISSKKAGAIVMIMSIVILFIFPWNIRLDFKANIWSSDRFDFSDPKKVQEYVLLTEKLSPTLQKYFFWIFVADFIGLSYIGMMPAEKPYKEIGLLLTFIYFLFFTHTTYIVSFKDWLNSMKSNCREFSYELGIVYYYSVILYRKLSIFLNYVVSTKFHRDVKYWYNNEFKNSKFYFFILKIFSKVNYFYLKIKSFFSIK